MLKVKVEGAVADPTELRNYVPDVARVDYLEVLDARGGHATVEVEPVLPALEGGLLGVEDGHLALDAGDEPLAHVGVGGGLVRDGGVVAVDRRDKDV